MTDLRETDARGRALDQTMGEAPLGRALHDRIDGVVAAIEALRRRLDVIEADLRIIRAKVRGQGVG